VEPRGPRERHLTTHQGHILTLERSYAVCRVTEGSGAAYVAVQTAAVEHIEQSLPPAPAVPPVQLLSVDGAMVSLVHKEWAEVKTLALGTVGAPVLEHGEWVVHTGERSRGGADLSHPQREMPRPHAGVSYPEAGGATGQRPSPSQGAHRGVTACAAAYAAPKGGQ
jgi:hypothetical protein